MELADNAPMIPRREVIAILNELQLMQTRLLIILNQHAPEHFKETEARQPKVAQPEWSSNGTGHFEQPMVHTVTGE